MTTTRRRFLKGMGLGLSAPLLYPLLQNIHAQDNKNVPRRFVFLVEGNGIEPQSFLSPAMRAHLETMTGATGLDSERLSFKRYTHDTTQVIANANLSQAPCLGALGSVGGEESLEEHAAVLLGLSSRITGGGHDTNFGALSSTFAPKTPIAASIDHHLSTLPSVRQQTIFDAVRLTVGGRGKVAYDTCARGPGQIAPMIIDPVSAFNKLFGWLAAGEGKRTFEQRSRLLAMAQRDADRAVKNFSGSSSEGLKLQRYLDGINTLIAQQNELAGFRMQCEQGMATCDFKPLEPTDAGTLYTDICPLKRMEAHTDLAISALRGGLTNVVVLGAGTGGRWGMDYHSLSHLFPKDLVDRHNVCHNSGDPAMLTIMREATSQYVGMAARIARALLAEEEPSSPGDTMLDHTVIVVMSDNGEQHHSQANEWPVLLIGGKKMNLSTTNQGIIYPRVGEDKHRVVTDLFVTLDNLAGGELDADPVNRPDRTFGQDDPKYRQIKSALDELYAG